MGSNQSSTFCTKQSQVLNTTGRSPYFKRATLEETAKISIQYGNYLACKRRQLLKQIKLSQSRRNGFNMQEEENTIDEHWMWSPNNSYDEHLQLQAVNCSFCGGYVQVSNNRLPLCDRIRCCCEDRYYEDPMEECKDERTTVIYNDDT
jgi:hypothetical protein